jgi:hypothetical protein
MLNPLKIIYNNKETELTQTDNDNDKINFTFGMNSENVLSISRNPFGTLYTRTGNKNDVCVHLNELNKNIHTIVFETDSIHLTFKNE